VFIKKDFAWIDCSDYGKINIESLLILLSDNFSFIKQSEAKKFQRMRELSQ